MDKVFYETFSYSGRTIEDDEVPKEVLKAFRRLAIDIIKTTETMAENNTIEEEEYTQTKTRKVISYQQSI